MSKTNFPYRAEELSAFVLSLDTFIISLKSGKIIRHATNEIKPFYEWLVRNNVRDIATQKLAR